MMTFLQEVSEEVRRAAAKFPRQESTCSLTEWLSILTEEVGEVARELNDDLLNPAVGKGQLPLAKRLREELVQVAAMAERMALAVKIQLEVPNR